MHLRETLAHTCVPLPPRTSAVQIAETSRDLVREEAFLTNARSTRNSLVSELNDGSTSFQPNGKVIGLTIERPTTPEYTYFRIVLNINRIVAEHLIKVTSRIHDREINNN